MPLSAINKTVQVFKDTEREDVEGRGGRERLDLLRKLDNYSVRCDLSVQNLLFRT